MARSPDPPPQRRGGADPDEPALLQDDFREVMAHVCTPVAVVTAMSNGLPHGTTVSAFASLSMDPPMILVSLSRSSDLLAVVRATRCFGVNMLASEQSALAVGFARKGGTDKFNGVPWQPEGDVPRIPDAAGFLVCRVSRLVEGGDHIILLGEVVSAHPERARPLTYHRRAFGTHLPHHAHAV
ncbi:flavin reductase family protein [Micromonospora sp. LAH09]|uniref:flavin reductase family protein n=1 Tax=Micromonospora cabrerizensis TaxID=2911213 RepID=UPI001EE950B7|nr:flavin reductase family protein [Micromonospora cabrerizensis]MCG5468952.1 flavin reductase family protein [Micromonospora cabrerizensis]